ncbi:hypothetical protein PPTG_12312 [Phytophthora nicotianae INRA-310]|uniref:Uncharacterized protein n=1 Tax=Phytophthora nicotianae (strain INRA-310) TaxID=761204 RepID=W2Q5S4_PHYN3|nr:hypothetical protein PPTG_12312 [Phytophthora nicotianae INRA-310]ETN08543.1 hypothetical protein PPTG_12312 [Phytophthora nicotianae INRA-310]
MFAHAAECTEDDFITISEVYRQATADGTASCPDLTAAPDAADYCSYTECLRYMTSMLDDLPDCTSAGVSIKEGLQAAIDICDGGTTDILDTHYRHVFEFYIRDQHCVFFQCGPTNGLSVGFDHKRQDHGGRGVGKLVCFVD